jgi:hypothetical protein
MRPKSFTSSASNWEDYLHFVNRTFQVRLGLLCHKLGARQRESNDFGTELAEERPLS